MKDQKVKESTIQKSADIIRREMLSIFDNNRGEIESVISASVAEDINDFTVRINIPVTMEKESLVIESMLEIKRDVKYKFIGQSESINFAQLELWEGK